MYTNFTCCFRHRKLDAADSSTVAVQIITNRIIQEGTLWQVWELDSASNKVQSFRRTFLVLDFLPWSTRPYSTSSLLIISHAAIELQLTSNLRLCIP